MNRNVEVDRWFDEREHPRLEGDGKLVRTMRFAALEDVEKGRKDLERVIKAWCKQKAKS